MEFVKNILDTFVKPNAKAIAVPVTSGLVWVATEVFKFDVTEGERAATIAAITALVVWAVRNVTK